jgi:hypothetical protein
VRKRFFAAITLVVGMLAAEDTVALATANSDAAAPAPTRHQGRFSRPSRRQQWVWIPGYHRWRRGRYVWEPGRWAVPPRRGAVWVAPGWRRNRRGDYVFVRGRWR